MCVAMLARKKNVSTRSITTHTRVRACATDIENKEPFNVGMDNRGLKSRTIKTDKEDLVW